LNTWGALKVGNRLRTKSVTVNYTITHYDDLIFVDASGGAKTISLPSSLLVQGKIYKIVKSESSSNIVTLTLNGVETIEGESNWVLRQEFDSIEIVSGGTGWVIQGGSEKTPAGTLITFAGSTCPKGYVSANGASFVRTEFGRLFAVVGTAHGAADGTHFNVPQLQGKFIRGFDNSAGIDPDAGTRTTCNTGGATGDNVGSCQVDAIRNITGSARMNGTYGLVLNGTMTSGAFEAGTVRANGPAASGTNFSDLNFDASNIVPTGNDNRPINVTMLYCIKY